MNNISDLNKKVIYRITKVIYFFTFSSLFAVSGVLVYFNSIYYPYNENLSYISCKTTGISKNILKSEYSITGSSLTLEQKKIIAKKVCGIDPDITPKDPAVQELQQKYGLPPIDFYGELKNDYGLLSVNSYFTASKGVMEKGVKWPHFLLYIIGSFILLSLVFEAIRRIFYYIIFGTFRPKEN